MTETGRSVNRIAVVGCRTGIEQDAVYQLIDRMEPLTTVVISGGAKGVDTWAVERAAERGIKTVVIRPNWKKYGRGAGFKRNREIVLAADEVAAFWDGKSRGTENTIKHAVRLGRPVAIFSELGRLVRFITPNEGKLPTMVVPRTRKTETMTRNAKR